ncbi:MAG: thioredoxin domain-containing protein [Pseudomonadota bacterium]
MKTMIGRLLALTLLASAPPATGWAVDVSAEPHAVGSETAPNKLSFVLNPGCASCEKLFLDLAQPPASQLVAAGELSYTIQLIYFRLGDLRVDMLARCSGRFEEALAAAFARREEWAESVDPATGELKEVDGEVSYAVILSIYAPDFLSYDEVFQCLRNAELFEELKARAKTVRETYGIRGTPTTVREGSAIAGYDKFQEIIADIAGEQ